MTNRFLTLLRTILSTPYRALRWMMVTRPIRFTRFGTFYILFSIGVGAAAINTGNNLLYLILGILLGFIIISGFLSDSGLWGIRTEWTPLGSLYARQKSLFECRATKGWFPGVAVTIESHWHGIPPVLSFIPWIAAHGTTRLQVEVTPKRRGRLILDHCIYATHFPFGLFQKSHTWAMEKHWIVYPAIQKLPAHLLLQAGDRIAQHETGRLGPGSTPLALRDFRAGDPLRQVSWKMTAKRQRLIVKDTEQEGSEGDLFYLNAWPSDLTESEFDRFISFIASLIYTAHENGRPVGFSSPQIYFAPQASRHQLRQLLDYLALVDPATIPATRSTVRAHSGELRQLNIDTLWAQGGSAYVL